MKKKAKLILEIDVDYPGIKSRKVYQKMFDKWMKDFYVILKCGVACTPYLVKKTKRGTFEVGYKSRVKTKAYSGKKLVATKSWKEGILEDK
jgi:hypothetical protein